MERIMEGKMENVAAGVGGLDLSEPLNRFEPTAYAVWRASVEASLEGAAFEKKLVTRTAEGIAVEPLYPDAGEPGVLQAAVAAALAAALADDVEGNVPLPELSRDAVGWRVRTARRGEVIGVEASDAAAGGGLFDGAVWHDAGGTAVDEIGLLLARVAAALRGDGPMPLAPVVLMRVGRDFPMGVAKLRAARVLVRGLLISAGEHEAANGFLVHAAQAWRELTACDRWVNLLRSTVETAAALCGGADRVTTLAFDAVLGAGGEIGRGSEMGEHLARNTQIILREESHLARVRDLLGGSGMIEALTAELCEKGWARFRAIEARGGIVAALNDGSIEGELLATRAKRAGEVARRKIAITGVSEFPPFVEQRGDDEIEGLARALLAGEPTRFDFSRDAEPFERRVARADAMARGTAGARRVAVFLANLGPIAKHTARATFAANLYAAGGVASLRNDGFASGGEAAAAFAASGARVAVICSSDELYEAMAEEAARALCAAGARLVVLAGRGGEREAAYRAAGVGAFIYLGCDALEAIDAVLDAMGEWGGDVATANANEPVGGVR